MNRSIGVGLFLVFVGFLVVGSAQIYVSNANLQSISQLTTSATAQGVGWIVAGFGFVLAIYGLAADVDNVRAIVPDVAAIQESRAAPAKVAHVNYVCSDCGWDISADARACPHCGAAIDGD